MYMTEGPNTLVWQAVKWILGVFAMIGFYLMAWAFNTFTTKLDKVYDAATTTAFRLERLEEDQKDMKNDHKDLRDYVNKRYQSNLGNATDQMFKQGLNN